MDPVSQRQKGQGNAISSLSVAIEALNLAKEISSIAPAKAVFGSSSILLTMIRDSMANKRDYVELGLSCADICRALDRGANGKKLDELSQSVCDAITQLTMTVAEIQRKVVKQSGRNAVSRLFRAKGDKEAIDAWKTDLNRILHVFNTELGMNTHVAVVDIRHDVSKIREEICGQVRSTQVSIPGESPPPPPRACFGRDDLIEKIVGLAENLTPTALIGAGGIGKTSIVLAVLHNARIKQRFGDNRRFIRCDQFPTSLTNFLSRLSKVIGADIENPEDLTPLRPFLSSREMLLVLDNAESILDPQGTAAQEIYAVVEELSHLETMCLCITSRISTIPSDCETLDIPTLSMEAARDVFYRTYRNGKRSDQVNNILERLDFHPLSITLLATVAHHNKWDPGRLTREWERRRTGVLCTHHNQSLAATIELSLASPMFQKLGASTRDLLGVVAFFPQGIDENNFDWLFPTIPDQSSIFDSFCVLSLTYRSNGFITMLAPLRDYLRLKDPNSSPLLCMAKDCYFSRLLVDVDPDSPSFEEAQWITSEDVNVEHLLDIFTSINANSTSAWEACAHFMGHLYWYKPRRVVLGPKIKGLPDGHPSKPQCFLMLSQIFSSFGNRVESKQLLIQTLELWNKQGDDLGVAQTLRFLSYVNRLLGLHKEGVQQAKEALEIYEKLGDAVGQAQCLNSLAWLLFGDNQLNAAEEAASQAITLSLNQGKQYQVCQCHRILGRIYHSKGMRGKAMDHLEAALKTASSFNWHSQQFWILYFLAQLFSDEGRFDDAHAHIERAKFHATNDTYNLARAMGLQARFWYKQCRFEEATSVALDAADMFEKLGAMKDVEDCRRLIQDIEAEIVLVAF